MKVRLKTILAGPNGTAQPGQVIDVDAKEAKTLVDGKFAEYVDPPEKPEEDEKPRKKSGDKA